MPGTVDVPQCRPGVSAAWDTYETSYVQDGALPAGFGKRISPAELTRVKQHFARETDGATGVADNWPDLGSMESYTVALPFSSPFERTDRPGGLTRWSIAGG